MERPNPDQLLARADAAELRARRGKLMIFFGYAAGVGKTYAMLQAAHREKAEGRDVVVGYVEPHGRPETEALVQGLEVLPPRPVPYRGVALKELDLDAALARHPELILIDELAHTNAEGSRHAKRWQDVEELLKSGVDVFSTLNVQHVESLNDVIAQITGIVVRETLPDGVLEQADNIELVDVTPEELTTRLKEGKVYVPQQAERALNHFFQKANLTALREMAVRQVAQRLSKDVEAARQEKAAKQPWATNERLLVCIGPSPTSAKLLRTAKRMAAAFGAEWLAVAVEPIGTGASQIAARQRVAQHLRLAERLGAETHTLTGDDLAQTLVDFAVSRNVTKIVVGKSSHSRWKRLLFGTIVDSLLDRSGNIDVYVIRGESEKRSAPQVVPKPSRIQWKNYLGAALVALVCGFIGWLSYASQLTESNIVMVFLLGVALVAAKFGRGPAIATALANVLIFDFFFVSPILRFAVSDAQYVLTFGVMLIIGLVISALTARIKDQLQAARQLQRRTDALFRLTKQLTEVAGPDFLLHTAGQQLQAVFDGEIVFLLRQQNGSIQLRHGEKTSIAQNPINLTVGQWVAEHEQLAGAGTDTLPNATALFAPLIGSQGPIGAVGVRPNDATRFSDPEQKRLLETCASLVALSIERDQSVIEASDAQLRIQAEEMRSSLLSSVSHDLRTPLAVIVAASSRLLESQSHSDEPERATLLQQIAGESRRLARLVDNLLDITRLESGAVEPTKQWHVLEEIIGSALSRVRRDLVMHKVQVEIPPDFPLMLVDGVLIEQVFVNLLENAARHTPPETVIEIICQQRRDMSVIRVADNGPGITPGHEARIFEKFFRSPRAPADSRRGAGLGLAICKAIIKAHGGRLTARNRTKGGAEFVIELPCNQPPPKVVLDEEAAVGGT